MSNGATPRVKEFAGRLLAYEAALGTPACDKGYPGFCICEKLRVPLSRLMGAGGFRALLARAQAMAGVEVPWLLTMRINPNGSLDRVNELETPPPPHLLTKGELILVAHLVELLVTFIGPALTLRLMHDIWPDLDDLKF